MLSSSWQTGMVQKEGLDTRLPYERGLLAESDLKSDPIQQLSQWLSEATQAGIQEPNAMCVSTATKQGKPSSRMVLLRGLDERGLVFFTNYESRKGHEIAENELACACFWWGDLQRQVRVEGSVQRTSAEESDAYFTSRPLESRIASAVSPQSQVIRSRAELEQLVANAGEVVRPDHWGGYRLVPDYFEFWQGRPARLHDRLVYRKSGTDWIIERLAP